MQSITHMPYYLCAALLMCQKYVKLSKKCQIFKNMSIFQKYVKCQKVKHIDYGRH